MADSGVGTDVEQLEAIRCKLLKDEDSPSNHTGLQNTNRRLILAFGEQSHLRINSSKDMGTVVAFTAPKIHEGPAAYSG